VHWVTYFLSLIQIKALHFTDKKMQLIESNSDIHRFSHKAMATIFEILISHEDKKYARKAAQEVFFEVDRLEHELSRFIENSDISRINQLAINESTKVGPDAFECLLQCAKLYIDTNGAFDITIGSLMGCWLNENKTLRKPSKKKISLARQRTGLHHIQLDETQFSIQIISSPVQLDPGGFGKGYAVDKMAELLIEWDFEAFLIHGGKSSVLAVGSPPEEEGWHVSLTSPFNNKQMIEQVCLKNQAMSGSGLQKGFHIIDPRTAQPIKANSAVWTFAPTAATCDALSTAFIVMTSNEVKKYCLNHPEVKAIILKEEKEGKTYGEKIIKYGNWKQ